MAGFHTTNDRRNRVKAVELMSSFEFGKEDAPNVYFSTILRSWSANLYRTADIAARPQESSDVDRSGWTYHTTHAGSYEKQGEDH